jgi:hypothetical protein
LIFLLAFLTLRTYRRSMRRLGILHGWVLPDRRRTAVHWVGNRRHHSLRPVDLLLPILVGQLGLFTAAAWVPLEWAFPIFAIGNFVLAWLVMLPAFQQQRVKVG